MPRLNNRAYQILHQEIQKCAGDDLFNQIEQNLVLEDLAKLRSQSGSPATFTELRELVSDTYPQFSEKILSAAAKANTSLGIWGQIRLAVTVVLGVSVVLVGTCGALGFAVILLFSENSESVASNASGLTDFASMSSEEHFQEATVLVKQVEQSINNLTTPADLALCEKKLDAAKKHVDELPISSTVSSPVTYSYRSSRSRRRVRRVYEQQTIYNEEYASIRSNVEQLQAQMPELKAQSTRTGAFITAAKQFAFAAAKAGQNPPHSAARWQQIESLWLQAINRLEEIPAGNPGYAEAQKLLATYQTNLGIVQTRQQTEQESVEFLEQANSQIENLLASIPDDAASLDRNSTISQIQGIINELENVKNGTTAYPRAQELLRSAKNKLKQFQP